MILNITYNYSNKKLIANHPILSNYFWTQSYLKEAENFVAPIELIRVFKAKNEGIVEQ